MPSEIIHKKEIKVMEPRYKLTKAERLSGRKRIEHLYAKGKSFHSVPFRVTWCFTITNEKFPVCAMFTAPKKKFKKAVTRNRLKRLMRESYRKNKNTLYDFLKEKGKIIHLSFVFTGDATITYADTEAKIIVTLQRLMKEINIK